MITFLGCGETSPLHGLALAFLSPQERIQGNFPPIAHEEQTLAGNMVPVPLTGWSPHLPLWSSHFFPTYLPEGGPQVADRGVLVSLLLASSPVDQEPWQRLHQCRFPRAPQCIATSKPWEPPVSPQDPSHPFLCSRLPTALIPTPISQLREQKLRGAKQLA